MKASLMAISPLDGRYEKTLRDLGQFASEGALLRYRVQVEAHWFLHLTSIGEIAKDIGAKGYQRKALESLAAGDLTEQDLMRIKEIEQTTNHDVKAVEYFIRDKAFDSGSPTCGFIHFACTSEDINNLAYNMMLRDLRSKALVPGMEAILADLRTKVAALGSSPMLARTHGQTASPTTLGKELAVFGHRLSKALETFQGEILEGKLNGAVGNYNAHYAAYPSLNWPEITRQFIEERLGFKQNPLTTQIENHDGVVAYLDAVRRFNVILLGLCRDLWGYISLGYFTQRTVAGEVGSSTMPHKVNPIDFENAEGNLGLAISLSQHLVEKLPISRWQRDLSDSTVLRSLGSVAAYSVLAYRSCLKGLTKVEANSKAIAADLDDAWEVLAEPLQVVMKRFGIADAYERLKESSRGKKFGREDFLRMIAEAKTIPDPVKASLSQLTPATYIGIADQLGKDFANRGKA